MNTQNAIQQEEYLRSRVEPRPGDLDYIHLVDLLEALKPHGSDEPLVILDYGSGGSPYRNLYPKADYRRADFVTTESLDYVLDADGRVAERDGLFDIILSTQVAEHVRDPRLYFRESLRLLKSGGRFICTTHGTYPDHGCPHDFQRWTVDGLARDIREAGFEVESSVKVTTNGRAMMYIIQRFSGWMTPPASSRTASAVFRLLRSVLHRTTAVWHRAADRWFDSNKVVRGEAPDHEFYLGVIVVARKP